MHSSVIFLVFENFSHTMLLDFLFCLFFIVVVSGYFFCLRSLSVRDYKVRKRRIAYILSLRIIFILCFLRVIGFFSLAIEGILHFF